MTSVLVVAPLAVVLADDTLRKWFGASLAVRARPSRSPKAAPTVAVSQPAESPTLANSKTHSHGHPRWYSIGYKRSLRFFSKSTKILEEVLLTSQQKKFAKTFWDAENYGGSEAKCIKQLTERYGTKWHEITSLTKEIRDIREYYELVLILDHKKQWDDYRKSANIA